MFKFLELKEDTFGLDITDLSLKIIKLEKKSRGFKLVSFNRTDIKPGIIEAGVIKNEEALVKIIRTACANVKGKKLNTKYIIASLPEEKSFLQVIQMPKMNKEELKSAIPLQAENYIPLSVNDVYLDFQVISPVKNYLNYLDVLIVAIPKKIVDPYVSCFKKAGLIPLIFEVESQAIVRTLIKKETNTSPLILIDFGKNNTEFIIFSDHSIRFTCSIPTSSQQFTTAISNALKISFEEAEKLKIKYGLDEEGKAKKIQEAINPLLNNLVEEIQRYLDFYHEHSFSNERLPDGKIEKILLCGGGANLKGLMEFISKKLKIPAELGDPWSNLSLKKRNSINIVDKEILSFTTALGLSLRGICDKEDNLI